MTIWITAKLLNKIWLYSVEWRCLWWIEKDMERNVEVYFKAQAQHSPGGTMKYLIQVSWSLGLSFTPRISQAWNTSVDHCTLTFGIHLWTVIIFWWRTVKEVEQKIPAYLRYYFSICLEGLNKTTKPLNQIGQESILSCPKYEPGVPATHLWWLESNVLCESQTQMWGVAGWLDQLHT
jgi:hypothetical protein